MLAHTTSYELLATRETRACRVCGSDRLALYLDFGAQPLTTLPCPTIGEPDVPCTRRRIDFCLECHHVQLRDVVPEDVLYADYPRLESAAIPDYVHELAAEMAREAALREGYVFEIGCNNGGLLSAIRSHGGSVVGVDAARNCADATRARDITCYHGYFDARLAATVASQHGKPAVIVCRHVLEHVADPRAFLGTLRSLCSPRTLVVLEVPDFAAAIEAGDYISFTEQHVSYFTRASLDRLVRSSGWQVTDWREVPNNWSRALLLRCNTSREVESAIEHPAWNLESRELFEASRQRLARLLDEMGEHHTLALAGAFCRSANLIGHTPGLHESRFALVADDDPAKTGRRLSGTRVPVVPFAELAGAQIDVCLIAAIGYEERILARNRQLLERGIAFLQLFPERLHVAAGARAEFESLCAALALPLHVLSS